MKNGYARLQALWRSRKLQFRYNFGRDRIIGFQAMCRGYLARTQNHNKYEAVVVIQVFFYRDCITVPYGFPHRPTYMFLYLQFAAGRMQDAGDS